MIMAISENNHRASINEENGNNNMNNMTKNEIMKIRYGKN
jgi:hypothetical protein